jgi:hypothetical protein
MPTSPYVALLEIVRRQSDAAARGDVQAAVALMPERLGVLVDAPAPSPADHAAIHEVLRLDRDLCTAIRHKMIELRNQAVELQQGRHALAGYRPPIGGERRPRRLNAFS